MRLLRSVAANRDLVRLELGWAAASVVRWALAILISLYAYRAGGPAAVGVVALLRLAPAALLAPRLAMAADRRSRRRVLLASLLVRSALVIGMAITVWTSGPLAVLVVAGAAYGAADSVQKPTQAALLAHHARNPTELAAANTLWSMLDNLGFVVGSLLVGGLVAWFGLTVGFVACAVPLLMGSALVAGMTPDQAPPPFDRGNTREELLAGVQAIRRSPELRLLVGLFAADMLVQAVLDVLLVVCAIGLFDLGEQGAGWLSAAWGVGGVVGGAAATVFFARRRFAWGITVGLLLAGAPLVVAGMWPVAGAALVAMTLVGLGFGVVEAAALTLTQRLVPADVVARVYGAQETLTIVVMAVGSIAASALVLLLGEGGALVAAGLLLPACAVLVRSRVRALDPGRAASDADYELIHGVAAFSTLPPATVENLAVRARREDVPAGVEVITEGDHGRTFYVIGAGEVEVLEAGLLRRTEHPGEHFGEIALLRDVPRTATVRTVRPSRLLALDRDEFLAALGTHPRARHELDVVATRRLTPDTDVD